MERFNSFSSDQIILTKRQVSMIMASMLLFCLFIFIVGFFLGKRIVVDEYSSQVTKEALHDQIDFLLTTQSLQSSQDEDITTLENESPDLAVLENEISEVVAPAVIIEEKNPQVTAVISSEPKAIVEPVRLEKEKEVVVTSAKNGKQYAQLIGFGTKKAAQAFVHRLKNYDVPVILKTMVSKTAQGKQRTWYQAITPTYESAQELQTQISKIKRLEHIRDKDIKIVYTK